MRARLERAALPLKPDEAPDLQTELSVRAWNLMGGLDYGALDVVTDMLGIEDVEGLVIQLAEIRRHQNEELSHGR